MTKKEFLKELEKELKKINVLAVDDVIEYYDEYIEDLKEQGKKEKDIIKKFDMDELIKEAKIHKQIKTASEKPTISNGLKALIAFLGILSLPMLLAVGGVLFGLTIAALALIFSFVVTIAAIIFGSAVSVVGLTAYLISGQITVAAFLFSIGVSFLLFGLFIYIFKWAIGVSRELITWLAETLQEQLNKRRGGKSNE